MLDKEILADFQAETKALLNELAEVVEKLEETSSAFPAAQLAEFSQKIDRVMGAAQTMSTLEAGHAGLERIGAIAQICKGLGYKAIECKAVALVPLFAAFWADTLDVLAELVETLGDDAANKATAAAFAAVLQNRLTWLSGKVQAGAGGVDLQSQLEIDKILARLGK